MFFLILKFMQSKTLFSPATVFSICFVFFCLIYFNLRLIFKLINIVLSCPRGRLSSVAHHEICTPAGMR